MSHLQNRAQQITKEILDGYAATYHVVTPHQQEATVKVAAVQVEKRLKDLIVEVCTSE